MQRISENVKIILTLDQIKRLINECRHVLEEEDDLAPPAREQFVNEEVNELLQGLTEITWNTIPEEYRKAITKIVIPSSVTSIGSYAFSGCSSLKAIDIPDSVTSIGSYAFYNCSSLESIDIPGSVTSIGIGAFLYCTSLQSVVIPYSVTKIGTNAFHGCKRLKSIVIANSATRIGSRAFPEECKVIRS